MKALKVILLFGLLLLAFMVTVSVQSQTGITINNADSVTDKGITVVNGSLNVLLNQVSSRVTFEFANSSRLHELPSLPATFDTRLNQVTPRVVFEFANTDYRKNLSSPPGTLSNLFGQVLPRVTFEFANSSRLQELSYPYTLLNDTVAPQISNVSANATGEDSAIITWTTDEFADSQINCGTAPGNYTKIVSDALYSKDHAVTLTGLVSGQTYYFQVISADQSSNMATSAEFEFIMQIMVYLPSVIKNN